LKGTAFRPYVINLESVWLQPLRATLSLETGFFRSLPGNAEISQNSYADALPLHSVDLLFTFAGDDDEPAVGKLRRFPRAAPLSQGR
jgi:hypothetical protein